jgi:hypothetical protein
MWAAHLPMPGGAAVAGDVALAYTLYAHRPGPRDRWSWSAPPRSRALVKFVASMRRSS